MSEETTTYSYIVNFFNDMQALNSDYATYRNSLVRVHAKHILQYQKDIDSGKKTIAEVVAKIPEEERVAFLELADFFKFRATRTWIAAKSLGKHIKSFENKDIEKAYDEIADSLIPDRNIAANYVFLLNESFVEGISKDLLYKASSIVEGMVSSGGYSGNE